jgi:Protein of unknown function (DUF4099)/Protein of unknown function (DUF3945)
MITEIFEEADIPVAEFENLGLSKDGVVNLAEDDMKALLSGNRTSMIRLLNLQEGDDRIGGIDGKLSLTRDDKGNVNVLIHPVYREMKLPEELTIDDAEHLASGEIVNLEMKMQIGQEKRNVLVEFDQDTNEFLITDTEQIRVPDAINDQELTPEQKQKFKKGKEVELEDGTKVQYTATAPQGIRSNKVALVASLIVDGGLSYMLYKGLHAIVGEKRDKKSEEFSKGYYKALQDMENKKVNNRMQGNNVYSR